jgi:hypothetical protein
MMVYLMSADASCLTFHVPKPVISWFNPCAKDRASLLRAHASQPAMLYTNPESPPPPDDLYSALRDIALRPLRTLVPPWSWKAAALSALLRGITFYLSNLRSGHQKALLAMIVEAVFAVFAAGLIGAVSQRLRASRPVWATAAVVCLGLPALMVVAQLGVHRIARTPHVGAGLLASFCFASVSSAFSWYAMRHGTLLGGTDSTPLVHDILSLPGITVSFAIAIPRALFRYFRVN